MQQQGLIVDWNDVRGFGFVAAAGAPRERLFFHVRDWHGAQRPVLGQQVLFRPGRQPDGRPCAVAVRVPGEAPQPRRRAPGSRPPRATPAASGGKGGWPLPVFVLSGYAALLASVIARGRLPVEILFLSLLLCGIAWIAYALDKRAAQHGQRRIPEAHLHLVELAGGWPGALLAQRSLRHKNRKRGYQAVFWAVVVLHTAALAFWGFHA